MEYAVCRTGKPVGTIRLTPLGTKTKFSIQCEFLSTEVFRCYGLRSPEPPLLIGVLEPQNHRLCLTRTLSDTAIGGSLPDTYVLLAASEDAAQLSSALPADADTAPSSVKDSTVLEAENLPRTGDVLLDALLAQKLLTYRENPPCVSCPFHPQKPLPLAFAATACSLEKSEQGWQLILHLTPPSS